jgi:predicted ATPase
VEEMTKAVLEVGSAEAAERTVASVPPPAGAVPSTLHASLMARLDRLGPEAIEYYVLAAKRATAAMNNKEAKAHLKRGTTLLEQLPSSDSRKPKLLSRVAGAGWWLSS